MGRNYVSNLPVLASLYVDGALWPYLRRVRALWYKSRLRQSCRNREGMRALEANTFKS
jgi:hypothetical protein